MPRYNNDITAYFWPIHNRPRGSERMWVCYQILPKILADFNVSAVPIPQIPLQIFMTCAAVAPRRVQIAFLTMALAFGTRPLLLFI
jgi:hypothetical protein